MLLDLIYGGVGSGKTERCMDLIERTLLKNPTDNAILTVPDQYSYTAEKRLVERLGGTGLNRVEVLTFSQFFRRFIKGGKDYLTPPGRQALVYWAVSALKNSEYQIFANSLDKPGFIAKASELLSEMKRYLVTPEDLAEAAGRTESAMLSQKLLAFSEIAKAYQSLLQPEVYDSEDDFKRLSEWVRDSGDFQNTHIWFDGFSDFMPQHYEVIRSFLLSARSVHITLCMPFEAIDEEGVFVIPARTRNRLKKMAEEAGARVYEQSCADKCYTITAPEILHLMKNWDSRKRVYSGVVDNISLFCARNLYSETKYVAERILMEVKNGARYRDIGVMCTDFAQYSHLIEAVFDDFKIPYFSDDQVPVSGHPIILTVLAAFDITEENWSYESVFRYLRTGFIYIKEENQVEMSECGQGESSRIKALDRDRIDLLENYVLSRGIRGKKAWLSQESWRENTRGVFDAVLGEQVVEEDVEAMDDFRQRITAPFIAFYERTAGRHTVRELSEALYYFLCDIHLYEGISEQINILNANGMRNEAERMKEIWNLLMDTLNQAVVASGDKRCAKEDFAAIIREGLSVCSLQIIPPGLDSVSVGAADRNSPARHKIVFFMGAISGTLPSQSRTEGILTDSERRILEEKGLEMAQDTTGRATVEMFKCYRAVTAAGERLYFSYPTADSEGQAKQPSAFIRDLYRLFPNMMISDDLIEGGEALILTHKQAFEYMMRAVGDTRLRSNAKKLADFLEGEEEWKRKLMLVRRASEYRGMQPQISRESAKLLYNDYHRYSVSRLNDYSACPFSYFVKHGLQAKEQEVWQIQKFEIGSLLHKAVCEYCLMVEEGTQSFEAVTERWRRLTQEESEQIVNSVMSGIEQRTLERLTRNRGKVAYLLERMRKIVYRSVEIVRLSLSQGAYTAVCYEQRFQIDIEWNGRNVGLNGTIDRVDAAVDVSSGRIELRVIDYKSGKKAFDIVSVSNGSDMQLMVYAIAAVELYKTGALGRAGRGLLPSVSGILYNKLRNDMVSCKESEADRIEELVQNQMRMEGLVVVDEDEAGAAVRMDQNLEQGGARSSFMRLAVNSKGDALDKRLSGFVPRDRFDILTDFVKKTVVRLDTEIFDGTIGILPAKGKGGKACVYCDYKDICLYDARSGRMRKGIEKEDAAWVYMENEVKGGESDGTEGLDG